MTRTDLPFVDFDHAGYRWRAVMEAPRALAIRAHTIDGWVRTVPVAVPLNDTAALRRAHDECDAFVHGLYEAAIAAVGLDGEVGVLGRIGKPCAKERHVPIRMSNAPL